MKKNKHREKDVRTLKLCTFSEIYIHKKKSKEKGTKNSKIRTT